jgi:hypothetical protein
VVGLVVVLESRQRWFDAGLNDRIERWIERNPPDRVRRSGAGKNSLLRPLRRGKGRNEASADELAQFKKNGEWQPPQHEVVLLISSLSAASPQALLASNRNHWGIEIMHRNKDVILGEDGYTNRCDNAPRNIFSLTGFVLKILKLVAHSPTRAIEHFQDNKNRAIRLLSGFQ